jgi:beta-galactosidase
MTNLLNFTDPEKIKKLKKQLETDGTIPVPSRSSYFGIFDLCGFPKDRYYLYRSRWRPDVTTAHILPHWNWEKRRGMKTPVFVYTSGDEAELFLNGKSLGRRKKEKYKHRLCWYDVIYEPGIIRAETFKNGKPWCIAEIKTTGAPFKIKLEQEKKPDINFDDSLFFVVARITDEEGNTVPDANCKINFSVSGPGKIIAVDNGNPTSFKPFGDTSANAFNGLCLAVIKPAETNSPVILKAESPELEHGKLELR